LPNGGNTFIMRRMKSLLLVLLCASLPAFGEPVRFYVGTYTDKPLSQGIYTAVLDSETGKLGPLELAAPAPSPNFLALSPDGKTLYANVSTNRGSVAAFRVKDAGRLEWLNSLPSGNGGCHVAVDATGKNVFVANYSAGSLTGFRVAADGSLEKQTTNISFTGSGPDLKRQEKPHLHAIYFAHGNRQLYACDLGTDNIWQYELNATNGELQPLVPPSAKVPLGSGPRHLAFSPDGKFAFVNGEMGINVTAFAHDESSGTLKPLNTVSMLPLGETTNGLTSAEIFCHPSGRWLYVSIRDVAGQGRDALAVFSVGKVGELKRIQNISAGVKVPRGFDIEPSGRWLVVAGQQDNRIAVLKIDPATGRLEKTDESATVGSPVCILFPKVAR
jgi:6-phosphogluconolactonase